MAEKTRALTASESLTDSLLDAVEDRIVAVDGSDRIVKANRVATEQAKCEPEGRLFEEVFLASPRPQERRSELALIRYTFQTRTPQRGRLIRVPDAAFRARLLAVDTYPVLTPRGDVGCVIEIARDVTGEKEAEIQKQHREKMAALGMLAAGIAHDLGNPLASLSIELQLFERGCQVPSDVETLKVLNTHVDRITRTLREMVEFARRRTDQVEEVAVDQALADALRLVRHAQRSQHIQITTDLSPMLPRLRIRQDDLILILVNLLLNAFDAMPDGGTVTVAAASSERDEVVVRVRDVGVGMPPEVRERATEALYTTKEGGTGFGLAVSDDVMRAVGGRLELASEPGQGTTVSLVFPATGALIPC